MRPAGAVTVVGVKRFASRLRAMDVRRLDVIIGLVILVEGQLELLVNLPSGLDTVERIAAHVGVALPGFGLMLRTRAPVAAALIGIAAFPAITWMGTAVSEAVTVALLAVFVLLFSMAALTDGRRLVAGTVGAAVLLSVAFATDPTDNGLGDIVFAFALLLGASVLGGGALRNRLRLDAVMRERAARLERERGQAVEQAAADERARIAGELHDLVSHALTAMVVQASGARGLVGRDPDRARDTFAAIEDSGRDALTEMRRLLGVLRRSDEEIALAPQPSIERVTALVDRERGGGLPVVLEIEGEARRLPVGADVIAYRVVQQALRGAREGGDAGSALVRVRYRDSALELEIADDGEGERPLLAIQERVALYGGELVAGRRRSGGHLVRASIPIPEGV